MTLSQLKRGQKAQIVSIPDAEVRAQAIRFGISIGAEVQCAEKVWAGPIVISRGNQEIAVGRKLAERIEVRPA